MHHGDVALVLRTHHRPWAHSLREEPLCAIFLAEEGGARESCLVLSSFGSISKEPLLSAVESERVGDDDIYIVTIDGMAAIVGPQTGSSKCDDDVRSMWMNRQHIFVFCAVRFYGYFGGMYVRAQGLRCTCGARKGCTFD